MSEYIKYVTANQLRTIDKLSKELGRIPPYVSVLTTCADASKMIGKLEREQLIICTKPRVERLHDQLETQLDTEIVGIRSAMGTEQ